MSLYHVGVLLFLIECSVLAAFNGTDKFLRFDNPFGGKNRHGRFITFNSDSGELSVELEFNVPFISVPVKESLQMAKGVVANVNVGSILLSGAVLFTFAFLVPGAMALLSKKMSFPGEASGYTGHHRSDKSDAWRYFAFLDNMLVENNIDTTSCMQRITCWSVKNASKRVNDGVGTSTDKILDGVASNEWLVQYIQGSAIEDAIRSGYNGINCSKEYNKCQITQQTIQGLSKNFIKAINGAGFF